MNLARTWNGERNERFGWDFGFKLSKIASLKNKHNEISKRLAPFILKFNILIVCQLQDDNENEGIKRENMPCVRPRNTGRTRRKVI